MGVNSTIIKLSLITRFCVHLIQYVFNHIIKDHEPIPACFTAPGQNESASLETLIYKLFNGFKSWDAQYFLHVSKHGYTYENTLAFFPLFPYLSYYVSQPLSWLSNLTIYDSIFVSGLVINLTCFLLTSLSLFYLTVRLFRDQHFAFLTAIVFTINPASVFFSAFYSESLYCFLTFLGLLCIETNHPFIGSSLFGLSSGTRSNGIISCGFVIFNFSKQILNEIASVTTLFNVSLWLKRIMHLSVQLFLCFLPFVSFQVYSCLLYCVPYYIRLEIPDKVEEYAERKGFVMPSDSLPSWCYNIIPSSYSYVQKEYWDVGFLRYYQWKQLPNFALAAPAVILILNFSTQTIVKKLNRITIEFEETIINLINYKITMYAFHAVALTTFCVLCIHVQVTTRLMCSSSPVIYWSIARILMPDFEKALKYCKDRKRNIFELTTVFMSVKYLILDGSKRSKLVLSYCLIYLFLGTVLFSNHFPWT